MGLVMAMIAVAGVLFAPILIPLSLIGLISPELADMLLDAFVGIL